MNDDDNNILKVSGIDFLIDEQSRDIIKNFGGAHLDFIERKFFGSGFSLRLKEAEQC